MTEPSAAAAAMPANSSSKAVAPPALPAGAGIVAAPATATMPVTQQQPTAETAAPAASPAPGTKPADGAGAAAAAQVQSLPASTPAAGPATPSAPAQFVDDEDPPAKAKPAADAAPSTPAAAARPELPHNLSPWGMFLAADWVVKTVMISLAVASLLVWSAWIGKMVQVAAARRKVRQRMHWLDALPSLASAEAKSPPDRDPVTQMMMAAMRELDVSDNGSMPADGIKERITSRLARIEAAAGRSMNAGTGLLATVGGTAPFIGLFGTVWGIMNSFIGISKAQTTNLAVVAPGIAEALLATAIGLVAAIPAVIFYNQLARAIGGYKAALADAAAIVERHVSRDLDRKNAPYAYRIKAAE